MLFNSVQFLLFFIAVVTVYFSIPHKYRWILLLIASYYFYMCWNVKYIVLIIFSTFVDYYCGRKMSQHSEQSRRRKYLILSLCTNLGLLFAFKYFNFTMDSLNAAFDVLRIPFAMPYIHVLLPVGISFYTFQTLSYTIDVYRGKMQHEDHFGIFALYVSFFPQLVAGPIERASRLLGQFYQENFWDENRVVSGLQLMLWGMFKKVVVANRVALYVDAVYTNPELHSGLTLAVATYLFAFQIYCDFSGYTDIAIGAARVLGYDLMKNFERPYFATNIQEFWRRWHISLSTWFRDYLYIPLGGNRKGTARTYLNVFIIFAVSGMWHGANWTFLVWGALHGVYSMFSRFTLAKRDQLVEHFKIPTSLVKGVRIFITFQLVNFAWIYFRADSITAANLVVSRLFTGGWGNLFIPAMDQFIYGIFAIFILLLVDAMQEVGVLHQFISKSARPLRWVAFAGLIIFMLLTGVFNESQFIYFQF